MTHWKQCMNYSQKPKKSCLGITSPISSLEPNASSSLVLNFAAAPDFFSVSVSLFTRLSLSLPSLIASLFNLTKERLRGEI